MKLLEKYFTNSRLCTSICDTPSFEFQDTVAIVFLVLLTFLSHRLSPNLFYAFPLIFSYQSSLFLLSNLRNLFGEKYFSLFFSGRSSFN